MQGPGLGKSRSAAHILLPAFFHSLVLSTTKLEEPTVPITSYPFKLKNPRECCQSFGLVRNSIPFLISSWTYLENTVAYPDFPVPKEV